MTVCPHGIDCEVINATRYFHGHGDIVTGQQLWHDEDERCNGMTFEQWIKHVDGLLLKVWGVTSGDIADRLWRDEYESGTTPAQMVRDIVSEGVDAL